MFAKVQNILEITKYIWIFVFIKMEKTPFSYNLAIFHSFTSYYFCSIGKLIIIYIIIYIIIKISIPHFSYPVKE